MGNWLKGRNAGLVLCVAAGVLPFSRTSVHAQSEKTELPPKRVVLRILNGKTGWPILG
jgi:hypothetical protein